MSKKHLKVLLFVAALIVTFSFANISASAKVKTVTRNQSVLKGSSIILYKSNWYSGYKITIKNKSKIKTKKIKNSKGGGVRVTGKKVGKATVTLKTKKKHYIYKISILDVASTDALAKKQLQDKKSTIPNVTSYAYADFNVDGVTDLYADGFLYAYNYKTGKIKSKDLNINPANVRRILVSKKKRTAYFEASKDAYLYQNEYYDDPEEEFDYYKADVFGQFCVFDNDFGYYGTFFDCNLDHSIYRYIYPKEFVSAEEYVEGVDYYCFHEDNYDQDDYWYEPFTYEGIEDKLVKLMPEKEEIKLIHEN